MLRFGLPINGLDHFDALIAPGSWNGFPLPMVPHVYAIQIAEAVGDPIPEPYEGLRAYDGLVWQVICPECGSPLSLETGAISVPHLRRHTFTVVRIARPAKFWACTGCEHCEEFVVPTDARVQALRDYADAQDGGC